MPDNSPQTSAAARFPVSAHDRQLLRELGKRVAGIAQDPLNLERKRLWHAHDRGERVRPLVLAEANEGLGMVQPGFRLQCEAEWLRPCEQGLCDSLIHFEVLKDDRVVEPFVNCNWSVRAGDYGVEVKFERGVDARGGRTGFRWEAPIRDLEKDFGKLRPRQFRVDREASHARLAALQGIFDGVLAVRRRGSYWWTMGLTMQAIYLAGLENFMVAMCDAPAAVHRLMAFLCDDHLAFLDWLEKENLLTLNNQNDYIGSGSIGYCADLPQPDAPPGAPVRGRDLWVLLESQETAGVGPAQYGEFVFPYHQQIARRFGKVYYGCCEPVHSRWEYLARLPNLKRVSVSPWADQELLAERLAHGRYVYSRKPPPALLSTPEWDEDGIRRDLRRTLDLARRHELALELIMKDVHNINNEPHRLPRWVEMAREESERNG